MAALDNGVVCPLHRGYLEYCEHVVPACGECEYMMTGVEYSLHRVGCFSKMALCCSSILLVLLTEGACLRFDLADRLSERECAQPRWLVDHPLKVVRRLSRCFLWLVERRTVRRRFFCVLMFRRHTLL